ncbi:MAG: hypothetical protein R3C55_03845 [Parvularculaceae bacterium]
MRGSRPSRLRAQIIGALAADLNGRKLLGGIPFDFAGETVEDRFDFLARRALSELAIASPSPSSVVVDEPRRRSGNVFPPP